MTSKTPPAGTPVATGIASGSLGTGTAVDEETTLMAVPAPAGEVQAPESAPPHPRVAARRDPYRPIGIALAAILVALAGLAALSSGGDTPAQIGAPPAATASPGNNVAGSDEDDDKDDEGGGGNNGNNGNGNGRGNGNGGDNGRGND
jgi:hypothetical protein